MDAKFMTSLFGGDCPNGAKLSMGLTGGDFWPRMSQCRLVYRGQDGNVDDLTICAIAQADAEEIEIKDQFLPPLTIWHFHQCLVSHCGLESDRSMECIVRIDENGDMMGDMPNVPIPLEAELLAGGRVKLRWRYSHAFEEVSPTCFNIYINDGSGFDYATPSDTILYDLGKAGMFEWISQELIDGKFYQFVVRSDNETEAETINTTFVSAVIDSQGPPAITSINASWEEDQ